MNLHIIILAPTTGPVITIVGLLLVAGLISYLTAWFYAKSVYTPVIKGLEEDKIQLNREISGLKDDIGKLEEKVDQLNRHISKLEQDLSDKEKLISEKEDQIIALKNK